MKITVTKQSNCVYCGKCFPACPTGALGYDGESCVIDPEKCVSCGTCMDICPCDVYSDIEAPAPVRHEGVRELETELLIIGGGASGIAAAIAAAQSGARVAVLEKMSKPGGCGQFALDMLMFNSKWQKALDPRDLTDDLVRAGMNTTRGELKPELIRSAFGALAEFFDDFCLWGSPEENFRVARRMSDWYYHRPDDGGELDPRVDNPMLCTTTREGAGSFIMRKSIARCRELGVNILTNHAARDFIMENGRPAGVIADEPGGETHIRFRACIAAAGNLLGCHELIAECLPDYAGARRRPSAHAFPGNTGDAVLMGRRAGLDIDLDNICSAMLGAYGTTLDRRLTPQFNRAETMKVDLRGRRWINETSTGEDCVYPLAKLPECTTWEIMDSRIAKMPPMATPDLVKDPMEGRNMFMTISGPNGEAHPMAIVKKTAPYHFPIAGMSLMTGDAVVESLERIAKMRGGTVARGDTIRELAENMGLDPDALENSVARYNELCAKGHDDDFYKAPSHMLPIQEGPFYALNLNLVSDGVFGGFYIDENARVLSADKTPVPGLFASGDNTSSRYVSMTYQKKEFMNDFPWALASGRLAGLSAAKYIKEAK